MSTAEGRTCVTCGHHRHDWIPPVFHYCRAEGTFVDRITGKTIQIRNCCDLMRRCGGLCGPQGKLWIPREPRMPLVKGFISWIGRIFSV